MGLFLFFFQIGSFLFVFWGSDGSIGTVFGRKIGSRPKKADEKWENCPPWLHGLFLVCFSEEEESGVRNFTGLIFFLPFFSWLHRLHLIMKKERPMPLPHPWVVKKKLQETSGPLLAARTFQAGALRSDEQPLQLTGVTLGNLRHISISGRSVALGKFGDINRVTPLKTNMSPENRCLEDVFPTEMITF